MKKSKLNVANRTMFIQDNLPILDKINSECIDLIYLDPPFNSNKNYAAPVGSKAAGAQFDDMWHLEDVDNEWLEIIRDDNKALAAFLDSVDGFGGKGDKSYLIYMARRLIEMQRILKSTGSIYLHCDPVMSHSLKIVMDCIFGKGNFCNEIVWRIGWVSGYKTQKRGWIRNHDILLYYVKSSKARKMFNKEYIAYPDDYVRRDGNKPTGKGFPIEDTWNCHGGDRLDSIMIKSFSQEKTGYPTQKPLALVERIIKASSNKGDVVFDPFCGCATALVAAERLERQWIGCDLSDKAIELIRQRLQAEELLWTKVKEGKNLIERTDLLMRTDEGKDNIHYKKHKPELYMNQAGICNGCEKHFGAYNMHVDHIFPKSKGGSDNIKNLQCLCGGCNSIKGVKDMPHLRVELKKRGVIK